MADDKKITGEANLRDMSEVRVREEQRDGVKVEIDEKNRRQRRIEGNEIGPWEELKR